MAAGAGAVKPGALRAHTLLVRAPNSSTQQVANRELARAGIDFERAWELDSSEAIKRAAREGLGIAFLSRYAVAEEVERGEVARRPAPPQPERARFRRHAQALLREERRLRRRLRPVKAAFTRRSG